MPNTKLITETTGPAKTGISSDRLHLWIHANGPNDAQAKALWAIRSKWDHMEEPNAHSILAGCIQVVVADFIGSMVLCIQPDGYTHS